MQTIEPTHTTVRTPEQAAPRLLTTPRTLERWRANGTGPKFVKIGRRVGYRDADLDAFIAANVRSHTGQKESAPTRTTGTRR